MKPLLITSGEPAGIGPELCALLAESPLGASNQVPLVILGDADLLTERARAASISPRWRRCDNLQEATEPGIWLLHVGLRAPCQTGKPDSANGAYVLELLDLATDACLADQALGMVTAPIQKSAISPIWPGFQGHTEYLAQRCSSKQVVMMLSGGGLRVALATTHIPLSKVSEALNQEAVRTTLEILVHDLQSKFMISRPRILIAGLNPHAGESGTMGREEIDIILPVLQQLNGLQADLVGPLPADTLFQPKYLDHADAVLAMYHDQGLPVLKFASFGQGVNITLGLPIIRTSVDHGTALDLAGTRNMNTGSFVKAIEQAYELSGSKQT